jgi:hypothetical protein
METCSHVARQIRDRKLPAGRRFTIVNKLFVCDDCFNLLGFERFISLADLPLEQLVGINDGRLEALEAAYNAIESRAIFCVKCVAELERQ